MRLTVRHIQETVAEHFDVPAAVMDGKRLDPRSPHHVPRQIAMFLARKVCVEPATSKPRPMSYPHIGRIFRRDHSTIIHAERKVERLLKTDSALAEQVNVLVAILAWEKSDTDTSMQFFETA